MNHCIFVGNLVAKPELIEVEGAKGPISNVKFKIGVNERYGQKKESAFPFCEAWGPQADLIAKHFDKGDLIRVYCKFVTDTFPDKTTGETVYRDKFRVDRFEFVESKKGADTPSPAPAAEGGDAEPQATPEPAKPARSTKRTAAKRPDPVPIEDDDSGSEDGTPW